MRSARPLYDNQKHREAHHYHSKRGDGQGIFHIGSKSGFPQPGHWPDHSKSCRLVRVLARRLAEMNALIV